MPESLNREGQSHLRNQVAKDSELQPANLEMRSDLVCGVDRSLVEAFLGLIRDNFSKADKAQFFLEQRTGVVNFSGISNLRDVISHLASFLSPTIPEERRLEQLYNAEEHLRRAIIEPYEIAVNDSTLRVNAVYDRFKQEVLPVRHDDPQLANAPTATHVEVVLRQIGELSAKGRSAKARNLWDTEWEAGVVALVNAYEMLTNLHRELETYLFIVEKKSAELHKSELISATLREDYSRLKRTTLVLTIITIALAIWTIISFTIPLVRR